MTIDNIQNTKHSLFATPVFGARRFWSGITTMPAQSAANLFLQRPWVKMKVTGMIIANSAV
jgi:hypothetical protein